MNLSQTPIPVRVAADTDTGRVRQHNEDAFLIAADLGLFAVADGVGGHVGGVEASRLVVHGLPQIFKEEILADAGDAADDTNEETGEESGDNSGEETDENANKDSSEASDEAASGDDTDNANKNSHTSTSTSTSTILDETLSDTDLQRRLYRAIRQVNTRVFVAGGEKASDSRMGATLTGALFLSSGTTLVFNVGDSRTYCYRDKELSCVTKDQSWYQSWLDNGSVGTPPPRSVILQGVGLDESVVPDWTVKPWQPNDLWLMCSDGLTDRVSEEEITRAIEDHFENNTCLVSLCGDLITTANEAGGEDNITVLALRPNSAIS